MIPVGTPRAMCSARWERRARATGSSIAAPSTTATASSSAADDDNPAPDGTVEVTVPAKPATGPYSATTPAAKRAQGGCTEATPVGVDDSGTRAGRS